MRNETEIDYCVVGSGPFAATVLDILASKNVKILVIDRLELSNNNIDRSIGHLGILKSYKGSFFPYQLNNSYFQRTKQVPTFMSSKSYGGFSLVWGATLDSEAELPNLLNGFDTTGSDILGVHYTSPFRRFAEPQRIAVNKELCVKCGLCLYGCPKDAIWNSKITFENLRGHANLNIVQDNVETVSNENDFWSVKGRHATYKAKKLILCGGIMGNLEILGRSKLLCGEVLYKENLMFYGLFFHAKKTVDANSFALSSSYTTFKVNGSKVRIQLYEDIRGLQWRSNKSLIRNSSLLKFYYKVLNYFVTAYIGYMDEDISPDIIIDVRDSGASLAAKKSLTFQFKLNFFQEIFKYFWRHRIFTLGIRFAKSGAGFHVGHIHGSDDADEIRNTSTLSRYGNLLVLDNGILERLEPGPITHTALLVGRNRCISFVNDEI